MKTLPEPAALGLPAKQGPAVPAPGRALSASCSVPFAYVLAIVAGCALAEAQAPATPPEPARPLAPPAGPRDLIVGSNKAREARQVKRALAASPPMGDRSMQEAPPRLPQADQAEAEGVEPQRALAAAVRTEGHGKAPHASLSMSASAGPSPSVPAGQVRVRVLDMFDKAVSGVPVRLGSTGPAGSRSAQLAKTDARGVVWFKELPTGSRQAYRASLRFEGAQVAAEPFRLPLEQGYDVLLRRLPTTRDARAVLLLAQMVIEITDERVKVSQQVRLSNLGGSIYVFPSGGQLVELPEGAMAFRTQEGMGDQRMVAEPGKGFRLSGSLPPGNSVLTWTFDLPRTGKTTAFRMPVPWNTYIYQVTAEHAPGMVLRVDGFPGTQVLEHRGRELQGTQLRRSPGDPPLKTLSVTIDGIPGLGPWRVLASGLALVAVVFALVWTGGGMPKGRERMREAIEARKQALLREAEQIEALSKGGQIGPETREREMRELLEELAALLHQQAQTHRRAEADSGASQPATGQAPAGPGSRRSSESHP